MHFCIYAKYYVRAGVFVIHSTYATGSTVTRSTDCLLLLELLVHVCKCCLSVSQDPAHDSGMSYFISGESSSQPSRSPCSDLAMVI